MWLGQQLIRLKRTAVDAAPTLSGLTAAPTTSTSLGEVAATNGKLYVYVVCVIVNQNLDSSINGLVEFTFTTNL